MKRVESSLPYENGIWPSAPDRWTHFNLPKRRFSISTPSGLYLLEREGVETADRIVTDLFKSFYHLADNPAIGHRRPDLTTRDTLFYKVFSYLVIYLSGSSPLQIVGVIHGKRDVARILRGRI